MLPCLNLFRQNSIEFQDWPFIGYRPYHKIIDLWVSARILISLHL